MKVLIQGRSHVSPEEEARFAVLAHRSYQGAWSVRILTSHMLSARMQCYPDAYQVRTLGVVSGLDEYVGEFQVDNLKIQIS